MDEQQTRLHERQACPAHQTANGISNFAVLPEQFDKLRAAAAQAQGQIRNNPHAPCRA